MAPDLIDEEKTRRIELLSNKLNKLIFHPMFFNLIWDPQSKREKYPNLYIMCSYAQQILNWINQKERICLQ